MIGVMIFTGLAMIFGIVLTLSQRLLNKEEIEAEKIEDMLPGYNCGVCGFAGCKGMAEMLLKDIDNLDKCKPIKKIEYNNIKEYFNNK